MLDIFPSTCSYRFSAGGTIAAVATTRDCNGSPINQYPYEIECGGGMPTPQPLPAFGDVLSGSSTYIEQRGGATVTITWSIEPVLDQVPPKFTSLPPGGPLGCNPTNIPDDLTILAMASATAASGKLEIEAKHVDVTNGCKVTRSFTLTARDKCLQTEAHALAVYWWTEDTEPPVITSVPLGGELGCNPANPPNDTEIKSQARALDNCIQDEEPEIQVSHTDRVTDCTVTRTFSITAADSCGNVSPAKAVAYTWTVDKIAPSFTHFLRAVTSEPTLQASQRTPTSAKECGRAIAAARCRST